MAKQFAGFTPKQTATLLQKMGYTGPADSKAMAQFIAANPAAAAKLGKYTETAQRMISGIPAAKTMPPAAAMGMAEGGQVVGKGGKYYIVDSQGKYSQAYNTALDAYYANKGMSTNQATGAAITPYGTPADTTTGAATTGITGSTNAFSNIDPAVANVIQNVNPAFGNVSNAATTGTTTTGGTAEEGLNISARDIGGSLDDFLDFYRRQHGGTTGGTTGGGTGGGTTTTPAIPVAPTAPSGDPLEYMRTKVLLPDYAEQPLADVVKKGTDVSSGTIGADNTVTFADGTTIKARNLQEAQYIVNAGKKYTTEVVDPFKQLQQQYQQDLTAYQQYQQQAAATTQADPEALNRLRTELSTAQIQRDNYLREIQTLPADDPRRTTLSNLIQEADKTISGLQQQVSTIGGQQIRGAQQALVTKAYTAPEELVTKAAPAAVGETATQAGMISAETGKLGAAPTTGLTTVTAGQAATPGQAATATFEAVKATPGVESVVQQTKAATGTVTPEAQVTAQTMDSSTLAQLGINAAELAAAQTVKAPPPREVQAGELVSGPAVDMARVEELMANVQAAEATPSDMATVQGQMAQLLQQFDAKEPPAWAAGAMRKATATLAARGLGASSMAGQAVVQAAMESALPIAMQDAQTRASFEAQNLSNRQQVAMFAAQQRANFLGMEFDQEFQTRVQNAARIADIANMNFSADVQIALENSRNAQSVDLANLSAKNAKILSDAAAMTQVDLTNLNSRQQAAVQNAAAFLQMNMANLNNEQQTLMFNSQSRIQALLTDAAAENASRQFNATSKMQVDQFNKSLAAQIDQFNTAQSNAIAQFNAGEANALEKFNAEIKNARDVFEAQNALVIAQSNAKWRQEITTLETQQAHQANMEAARAANAVTQATMEATWQRERDLMQYAFTAAENSEARATEILLAKMDNDATSALAMSKQKSENVTAIFSALAQLA